jgi:putative redox protein
VSWVTAATGSADKTVDIRLGARGAIVADASDALDGTGRAPAPFDLLLASLGASTAIALKAFAAAQGWPLEAVEVDVSIVSWRGAKRIEHLLSIAGPLDRSQREALCAAAEHSPVACLLRSGVELHTELA